MNDFKCLLLKLQFRACGKPPALAAMVNFKERFGLLMPISSFAKGCETEGLDKTLIDGSEMVYCWKYAERGEPLNDKATELKKQSAAMRFCFL